MKKDLIQKATAVTFSVLLFLITGWNLAAEKKEYSELENRKLADFPSLSAIPSGNFDDGFENWFSDHFLFRDNWVMGRALLRKATLSIENNDVYFAEGRLVRRFPVLEERILDQNISVLEDFCAQNHIYATLLLVPTSAATLSGTLPAGSYDQNQKEILDEVSARLKDYCFSLDLFSTLQNEEAYYKTDHHWNHIGAGVAYRAICEQVLSVEPEQFHFETVSDSFRGTMYSRSGAFWYSPDTIVRFTPERPLDVTVTIDGADYSSVFFENRLNEKDQYPYYLDGNHDLVHISTNAGTGRHAVIIKDSYAHVLLPYLITLYDEIDVVDLRYYHDPVSALTDGSSDFYVIYSLDNFCEDVNLVFLK